MAAREPFNVTAERATPSAAISGVQRSPWHSPVPYLFGGLAAMLGLIAFALLILACSYWKLSGYLENENRDGSERDLEAGGEDSSDGQKQPPVVFEEKILVIMAGEVKPTFLATPMSSRSSSFGVNSSTKSCSCNEKSEKLGENVKQGNSDDEEQSGRLEVQSTTNQSLDQTH